ncbi:hypothetical protein DM02DRAFT_615050 [Periconia macrospinosa]|uniref:Uncharacterized protein n=1 Tax=Periconia macrospinosa TaxID=97972 RepID=A0A2V1DML6_9PLEO|nr:hypothetical protein DM02DRAFT_615050 [Periconia macrospinosa]
MYVALSHHCFRPSAPRFLALAVVTLPYPALQYAPSRCLTSGRHSALLAHLHALSSQNTCILHAPKLPVAPLALLAIPPFQSDIHLSQFNNSCPPRKEKRGV